jgi:hypothetical protein
MSASNILEIRNRLSAGGAGPCFEPDVGWMRVKLEFRSANHHFTNRLTLFCSVCKYGRQTCHRCGFFRLMLQNGFWQQDQMASTIYRQKN